MKITLYIGIGEGEVKRKDFMLFREMNTFIGKTVSNNPKSVWLFASGGEIFVTEKPEKLYDFVRNYFFESNEYHLHQYKSYEDAYKVALDMREGSQLCYDKNYLNN